jgi:CheY-like chemotaxis protein
MTDRAIRLLHVEDDAIQRRLIQAHFAKLGTFKFEITPVESENEAIDKMKGGYDMVLLDYHLMQGNGLNCLRRIRQLDAHIPIIAISGVATPEIAAELLEAGADDYFSKDGFEPEVFSRSVRAALARADAWKAHAPDVDTGIMSEIVGAFQSLSADFVKFADPSFVRGLDRLETAARKVNLTFAQLMRIFESVCDRLSHGKDPTHLKRLLRPVLLEMVLRLFEEPPSRMAR